MKRKKLRNGYGSIKFLGKTRSCPYGVYAPAVFDEDGKPHQKPLGYVRTWEEGFAMLTAYHAGTYSPGMDITLPDDASDETIMQYIMRRYTTKSKGVTFAEVYERFYEWKYSTQELSEASRKQSALSFRLCAPLHNAVFADLRHDDLQKVILSLSNAKSTKSSVRTLLRGLYKYAMINDLVQKDYSAYLKIDGEDVKHGTPFSETEIKALWKRQNDLDKMILIMIYSGFRVSEFQTLEINLEGGYFKGGIKTQAGKGRIVPIHSAIRGFVGEVSFPAPPQIAYQIRKYGHTPHDTRHTFSALCEKYKVPEADRKRLMGHSLSNDVTNGVYGHRTVEELRESIELIRVPSG